MAAKKVNFDSAAASIEKQINEVWGKQKDKFDVKAKSVAEQVTQELKRTSPKRTGHYSEGWDYREEVKSNGYGGTYKVFVVHNKHYRLTHLLNNGHASRDGSWVNGDQHITKIYRTIPKLLGGL